MRTRNKVFCTQCKFKKYLFSSREKAEKYLSDMEETITDPYRKYPVRAYYCSECDGWHVSSRKTWKGQSLPFVRPQFIRVLQCVHQKSLTLHQKIEKEFESWMKLYNDAMDYLVCKKVGSAIDSLVALVKKKVVYRDGNYYFYRRAKLKNQAFALLTQLNYPTQNLLKR